MLIAETANQGFDSCRSTENVFKEFAGSGIVEKFIRCSTVSQSRPEIPGKVLGLLTTCPSLLRRRFKSGEPCRDTLEAILDGRDGSGNAQPEVLHQLQDIHRLVETMIGGPVENM